VGKQIGSKSPNVNSRRRVSDFGRKDEFSPSFAAKRHPERSEGSASCLRLDSSLCSEWRASSARQAQGQVEEGDQVERVVVEHVVHVAFEARTDIVGVHAGDTVSRDVVSPMTPADMLLQRLQPAVGQLLSPTAAGVMEDVDVDEIAGGSNRFQAMPYAAFDNHRPVERLAVEREQHMMVDDCFPKRGENGRFFGIIAGEQELDRRLAFDMAEKTDQKQGRPGQAAGFEV